METAWTNPAVEGVEHTLKLLRDALELHKTPKCLLTEGALWMNTFIGNATFAPIKSAVAR
jgi:hypothetical protein